MFTVRYLAVSLLFAAVIAGPVVAATMTTTGDT